MKILVTGGAGFIGSHVAQALLARGDTVVILDDFNDRYDPALKEARVKHMFNHTDPPKVLRGDICNRELVNQIFAEEEFDQVIHLAAWASVLPSLKNPYIYTSVNVDGTVNILEASRLNHVKNIVYASTSSVYGGIDEVPFKETMDVYRPASPYAASKLAGEIMCATWHNLYQIPITCLRFFTVYGPWGRPEMAIFKFTQAMLRGETIELRGRTTKRDFTYISDIVQGILAAADTPHGFAIYNLGENDAVPLPRLIKALETALNISAKIQEVPLQAGELTQTLADISRAQTMLGYRPETSIEKGVQLFAQWYKNVYVPLFEK